MGNLSDAEYTGKGIGVCVMDTGLFPHIDFAGRIWVFRDFVRGQKQPYDDNSHGTHVCGIIGGDGTASRGRIRGIAPGCGFIALKVLDGLGNGRKEDVLQAIEWILKNRKKYGIRIVNISVGTTCRTKMDHKILIDGVEKLWDQGLVVVAAAGNQGPRPGSVTAPGSSRKIITVGSSDPLQYRFDSDYSSRGPTNSCIKKPDIVAPGSRIVSLAAGSSYQAKSGTSMSTPIVAGCIALLLEKYPDLTNREIKLHHRNTALDLGYSHTRPGWGLIQCDRMLSTPPTRL